MAVYTLTPAQLRGAGIYNSFEIPAGGGTPSYQNEYSFNFDGADEYIDFGSASNLNFTADDPFTISVWFKKASLSSGQALIGKSTNGVVNNGSGWLLWVSGNLVNFRIREDGNNFHQIRDNQPHPLNTWVNYVVTYDGSRTGSGGGLQMYENGIRLTNVSKSGNFGSGTGQSVANMTIGARRTVEPTQTAIDLDFTGNIDESAVWDSELTQADVTAIYNSGIPANLNNSGLSRVPIYWTRLGENATWNGSKWTNIEDVNGSNNGIGTNMAEENRVTDVPS
jgi:hypothetical protein